MQQAERQARVMVPAWVDGAVVDSLARAANAVLGEVVVAARSRRDVGATLERALPGLIGVAGVTGAAIFVEIRGGMLVRHASAGAPIEAAWFAGGLVAGRSSGTTLLIPMQANDARVGMLALTWDDDALAALCAPALSAEVAAPLAHALALAVATAIPEADGAVPALPTLTPVGDERSRMRRELAQVSSNLAYVANRIDGLLRGGARQDAREVLALLVELGEPLADARRAAEHVRQLLGDPRPHRLRATGIQEDVSDAVPPHLRESSEPSKA